VESGEAMTAPEITIDSQVAKIFEWRRGFNAQHLIDIGLRLGLLRAFAEAREGLTVAALAEKLDLRERFVEVWCLTAYSFGILEADLERFRFAPYMDKVLGSPGHPRYLGGYVRLGIEYVAEDFGRYADAFRSGETIPFQGRGEGFAHAIAESTAGLHVFSAKKVLPELPGLADKLKTGAAILEVGCGTGNHLIQLARSFPNCYCTGVDIDAAGVAAARAAVQNAGLSERVAIHADEIDQVASPGTFDAAVMIEVLHEIAPPLRPAVMAACARALRTGGWLVIIDETYPSTLEEARRPEFLFPVQTGFEELLLGNVIPTQAEQERLLSEAGFTGAVNRSLIGEGFTLLTTQRP
jgi:SAM-dependent methyltransferase